MDCTTVVATRDRRASLREVLPRLTPPVVVVDNGSSDGTPEVAEGAVCAAMRGGRLRDGHAIPGVPVLGFVACGAVVRRAAFLGVGGFHPRYGIGGEEELLALDLAAAGWALRYREDVVAHHHPAPCGSRAGRTRRQVRNALWTAWLREPVRAGAAATARTALAAARDAQARGGLADALAGTPWVLRERRPVPPDVAAARALLTAT